MILELPYPPAINHYYGHRVAGKFVITYVTKQGKDFMREVDLKIGGSKVVFAKPKRLHVEVHLFPPDKRKRDIDGPIKPLLDAMQHALVYTDDAQIDVLQVAKHEPIKGGHCRVEVREM